MTGLNVVELLQLYDELDERMAARPRAAEAFGAITEVAMDAVEGTQFASITRGRGDHFQTLAPTHDTATAADRLQYACDSGPCVDTVRQASFFRSDDIGTDPRWPEFGPRVAAELGVRSMLSMRLVADGDVRASLNMYSCDPAAFTERSQTVAMVLTTHAGVVLAGVLARERVGNLEAALLTSRRIGTAIGVLMASQRLTSEQAFDLIRNASQHSNRRVSDIADRVIDTGEL